LPDVIETLIKRFHDNGFLSEEVPLKDALIRLMHVRGKAGNETVGLEWALTPQDLESISLEMLIEEADKRIAFLKSEIDRILLEECKNRLRNGELDRIANLLGVGPSHVLETLTLGSDPIIEQRRRTTISIRDGRRGHEFDQVCHIRLPNIQG